jgi:hypothetical protein
VQCIEQSSGVSGELLRAALDAVADASITRPEPDQAEVALRLIGHLDRRGAAGRDDHKTLRAILMSNGRVDEAAADRAVHPAADERSFPARRPLNRQLDPGQARFWRWHVGGQLLDEQAIDLGHGMHLVIDASPGCHFCANAVVDIDKDPMLARLFKHALWISRPEHGLAPAYWFHLNGAHPTHAMPGVLQRQPVG